MIKQSKYKYFKLEKKKKRKIKYLENNLNLFFPFLYINNSSTQLKKFNKKKTRTVKQFSKSCVI